ncbi:MAG: hypothetical protein ACRC5T_13240, partial [Cetobacterium sp.]
NILVKLVVDSREKDLTYLEKFKFDKKYSSEKIKIVGYEIHTPMKCCDKDGIDIKTSTGDVSIVFSLDDGLTWNKSNLSIELKKGSDFTSTLYSNWKRFICEIDRSIEHSLDFYLVYSQSTRQMEEHFDKLKSMKRIPYYTNPHKVVYDRMLELGDMGITMIYTHEIHEVVKRVVKHHIKKNKLQYK